MSLEGSGNRQAGPGSKNAGRLAIYTCLCGPYDSVRAPSRPDAGLAYFCYTDRPAREIPAPWVSLPLPSAAPTALSPREVNRFAKMHPHRLPEVACFEWSLYVDAAVELVGDVSEFFEWAVERGGSILMFDHPYRQSLHEEVLACSRAGHEWFWRLDKQMARYKKAGYEGEGDLRVASVILRRRDEQVFEMMHKWWAEYLRETRRDQLSLGYAAWATGVAIGSLGRADMYYDFKYFRTRPHATTTLRQRIGRKLLNRAAQVVGLRL